MDIRFLEKAIVVALLLIFCYLLYKRLLTQFQKDNLKQSYASLMEKEVMGDVIRIHYDFPNSQEATLELEHLESGIIRVLKEGKFNRGQAYFDLDTKSLEKGKYEYRLLSHNQRSKQFLDIS